MIIVKRFARTSDMLLILETNLLTCKMKITNYKFFIGPKGLSNDKLGRKK
jgi:hypothetical protein